MAEAVAGAATGQVGDDVMVVETEMVELLKTEGLALHSEVVTEKTAHARALLDNVCLQRNMEKLIRKEEKIARLLIVEKGKQNKVRS